MSLTSDAFRHFRPTQSDTGPIPMTVYLASGHTLTGDVTAVDGGYQIDDADGMTWRVPATNVIGMGKHSD